MRKRQRQIDYWGLMAAMIMASSLWCIWMADFWYLQAIEVRGATQHTQRYIDVFLKQQALQGKHILSFNPLLLREQLLASPLVKDVQFEREIWPARLTLKVQERQPAYVVYQQVPSSSQAQPPVFILDNEGVVLPLAKDTLKIASLNIRLDPKVVKAQVQNVHLQLIRELDELSRQKELPVQGTFDITQPKNLVLTLSDKGLKIWLGKKEDLMQKLLLIEPSLSAAKVDSSEIAYLDLRSWKYPVVKKKS